MTKYNIGLAVVILFHLIGLVLFAIDPEASNMSYVSILISLIFLIIGEKNSKFIFSYIIIFLVGYFIEVIGVQTGLLFGSYNYDQALGIKLLDVPLLIGINWICIVVAGVSLSQMLSNRPLLIGLYTGLFATILDSLIEPIAINYNFWSWENETIPFQNYLCWFITSAVLGTIVSSINPERNRHGSALYFTWFVFFLTLSFYKV